MAVLGGLSVSTAEAAPPSFTPVIPARLLDTRPNATTIDGLQAGTGAAGPGTTIDVTVIGRGTVPTTGVGAVVVNVTAANPTTNGYVTVYPTGQTRPLSSNLNFTAGQSIPNLVIAKVGTGGKITLYNANGNTDLIVDVLGWFSSLGSGLTPLLPARLLDTRPNATTIDGLQAGTGAAGPGTTIDVTVIGRGTVPTTGVGAVVVNVTAANPTTNGYVTVYPTGQTRPLSSNLNFTAGQSIPNLVIAKVGTGGKITLYNANGNTDLIVDVLGWFSDTGFVLPPPPPPPPPP